MLEVRHEELNFSQALCIKFGSSFGCSVLRKIEANGISIGDPKISNCFLRTECICMAVQRELKV